MRINPQPAPRPRCSARSWTSGSGILACAVLLAVLAAGCEKAGPAPVSPAETEGDGGDGGDTIEAVAPPAEGTRGPNPMPTIGASSAEVTSTGSEPPILRAVRVGEHPGLDRLVFEFDGTGLPAWHVEYVDRPVRDCGSGQPVPVAGDAWLQVRFSGAHAHTAEGVSTSGPRRRGVGLTVLRELVRICDFEAEVTWVAGLARPNPYTARVLAGPSRLVIDIAH